MSLKSKRVSDPPASGAAKPATLSEAARTLAEAMAEWTAGPQKFLRGPQGAPPERSEVADDPDTEEGGPRDRTH